VSSFRNLRSNHDFRLLWVAQTVSEVGSQVTMFVFPLVTFAITGSTFLAGLVAAVHLLGQVGALLPSGVLADRVDRRRLLRAASGTGALLYLSLAAAAVLADVTLVHLAAVSLLTGVAAGVFAPAELSALCSVVPDADLTTALSQNQARQHVASLVGGPLGALLYGAARSLPFAVDAASYALSWLLLGRLRTDLSAPVVEGPRPSTLVDLRAGAAYVWRHPLFRVLTGWSCLTNLSMNALFMVAVLRMVESGVTPLHIALVDTVAGAAGIVGALLAPGLIDRLPTGRLTIGVAWSPLPLVLPMAVWGSPVVVAAALGCVLLLIPAGNAGMTSYRLTVTPAELVGRTQAATQLVGMSALPLAPLLAGFLLAVFGGSTAILLCGVLAGLVALVPTLSGAVRAVPRPADWPVASASRL
jgi:hypothetical protein